MLPDREAAEELAAELTGLLDPPPAEEPRPVREALAGDDDAEDAQWLIVLEDPDGRYDPGVLREIAESREGWLEEG
ncbi:hypothetical protein [Streptomyces sp. ST2-7A]|uniref:hypothetical protein n=1 Tax=Streptomyces sp. ST2-7A TaxID=2907214 RepID=UPI001F39610F|nr:hypothetical protein [Streptomyces sp. ST2-7A]MCE7079185.1 hypothetical protein [Streptomyces sp. ST2-7A]